MLQMSGNVQNLFVLKQYFYTVSQVGTVECSNNKQDPPMGILSYISKIVTETVRF